MRLGKEKLLTPLLRYHNYHLIHHLFPRTPLYRHGEMWQLLEPELRKHDLAVQHDFAIKPRIYSGGGAGGRQAR
jgi:fatty acid desaturase